MRALSISSVACPEPQTIEIHLDSEEPTTPYCYEWQEPIIFPSLIDLNPPIKLFNLMTTVESVKTTEGQQIDRAAQVVGIVGKFLRIDTINDVRYNGCVLNVFGCEQVLLWWAPKNFNCIHPHSNTATNKAK